MADAEIISIASQRSRRVEGEPEVAPRPEKCRAITAAGKPCRNNAVTREGFCRIHERSSARTGVQTPRPAPEIRVRKRDPHGTEGQSIEEFLRRRLAGDYPIDDFGYDEELTRDVLMQLVKPLYDNYFRVRTLGIDRIPDSGPGILVGNHSGTIPLDAVMMQHAVGSEHKEKRLVRNVGADLVWRLPLIGPLGRKSGNVVACDEDAYELLRRGELLGVFPEGYKGTGKGWRERYKLQRFGRGGFIEIALRTRVPIIPVAIVGAEEAIPMVANAKVIAKLFGFPYFPITPTFPLLGPLGLLPFPSRWIIEFGEPISMDDYPENAAEDPMLIFDLSDRIRDTIQQMLYSNLNKRGSAFF